MTTDDTMLVQLTTGQLQELVRVAVIEALGELEGLAANRAPALLDRAGLARELGCSLASVDRMARQGLPFVRVGSVRRFERETALGWLARESGRQSEGQREIPR